MEFLFYFLIVFLSKFYFIDGSVIVLSAFFLQKILLNHKIIFTINRLEKVIFYFLVFLGIYALFISVLNGVIEIFWPLKFFKASLLWLLLALFFKNTKVDLNQIDRYIVLAVFFHSLIIISTIFFENFRDFIYNITGYEHRSILGLRSPGITLSFNATAIPHIVGLYIILFKNLRFKYLNNIIIFTILLSLMFLGRTIAFTGLAIILVSGILKFKRNFIIFTVFIFTVIPISFELIKDNKEIEKYPPAVSLLLSNYKVFVLPFMMESNSNNILDYNDNVLKNHYYLSESTSTILFGNSRTGHARLLDPEIHGETDSDLGIVNSINANGIFVTIALYLFYFFLFYNSSYNKVVGVICLLSLILTFKEIGFFTNHATQLLFIYFILINQKTK